jgi:hypothetical protein
VFKSWQYHRLAEHYRRDCGADGVYGGGAAVQEKGLKECVIPEKQRLKADACMHAGRQAFVGHCCGRRKLKERSGRK